MLALAAVLALSSGAGPLRLVALDFTGAGVPRERVEFMAEHLAARLAEQSDVHVTSRKDLQAILSAERQRELLGCTRDSAACLSELAGAVDADALISGQVARVGQSYQLNLKLLSSRTGQPLFIFTSELLPREEDVIATLNEVAPRAVRGARERLGLTSHVPVWIRLLPSVIGGIAIVSGGIELGIAGQHYAELKNRAAWPTLSQATAQTDVTTGQNSLAFGLVIGIAGLAALTAGLLWLVWGDS